MKPKFDGWMWTVLIVTALLCIMFVWANIQATLRCETTVVAALRREPRAVKEVEGW